MILFELQSLKTLLFWLQPISRKITNNINPQLKGLIIILKSKGEKLIKHEQTTIDKRD